MIRCTHVQSDHTHITTTFGGKAQFGGQRFERWRFGHLRLMEHHTTRNLDCEV
jgi:hypothetical protein